MSVSGCDIHPFARPPVRVQFFVNQLKKIALIETALFFKAGIGWEISGLLIVGFYRRHLVLEAGSGSIGTKEIGRGIIAGYRWFSYWWLIGTDHRQSQHRFLPKLRCRSHGQKENEKTAKTL
jgi:hypothetical protein